MLASGKRCFGRRVTLPLVGVGALSLCGRSTSRFFLLVTWFQSLAESAISTASPALSSLMYSLSDTSSVVKFDASSLFRFGSPSGETWLPYCTALGVVSSVHVSGGCGEVAPKVVISAV